MEVSISSQSINDLVNAFINNVTVNDVFKLLLPHLKNDIEFFVALLAGLGLGYGFLKGLRYR